MEYKNTNGKWPERQSLNIFREYQLSGIHLTHKSEPAGFGQCQIVW